MGRSRFHEGQEALLNKAFDLDVLGPGLVCIPEEALAETAWSPGDILCVKEITEDCVALESYRELCQSWNAIDRDGLLRFIEEALHRPLTAVEPGGRMAVPEWVSGAKPHLIVYDSTPGHHEAWLRTQGAALVHQQAPELLEQLRTLPPDEQKARLREDSQFRSWELCELLCKESEREIAQDPARAVVWAELAVGLAGTLGSWQPAAAALFDQLQAYALAHLGHARRVIGDGPRAESAISQALDLWTPAYKEVGDILRFGAHFFALIATPEP